MNPIPRTIAPDVFAAAALTMLEESKITSLVVIGPTGRLEGVLHLHDLWTLHLI